MNEENLQAEKKALIYDLLKISNYQFRNYLNNIATPPIFYYLMTCSNHELRQITNTIKFVLKAQKIKEEEQETPDLYSEKTILLTEDIYITLLQTDTTQSYFNRRKQEIDEHKTERNQAQKLQEAYIQEEDKCQSKEDEDLNRRVKKFNRYYKKYLASTEDNHLKEELLVKMDQVFQNFDYCFLEDNIALIGQDRYEILPSAKTLKKKIEEESKNNNNVIDRTNSQNFIYLYQTTLESFASYLQAEFLTSENFEFEKAFESIWEKILLNWLDEEDSKKEIRFEFYNKEWALFSYKAGFIGLHDDIVKKLYFFLQDECKKILENYNPQISKNLNMPRF